MKKAIVLIGLLFIFLPTLSLGLTIPVYENAFVDSIIPYKNYYSNPISLPYLWSGTQTSIGRIGYSFFKFEIPDLLDWENSTFNVYVNFSAESNDGVQSSKVFLAGNDWSDISLTFYNKPTLGIITDMKVIDSVGWWEFSLADLESQVIGQYLSLAIGTIFYGQEITSTQWVTFANSRTLPLLGAYLQTEILGGSGSGNDSGSGSGATAVPEPSTVLLLGAGLCGLFALVRKPKKNN